jgi:hypothetical protein
MNSGPAGPRRIDHDRIISETLRPPPKKLGVTHWSSRLDAWNDRAHSFVWTKTADQILTKANRQKTSKSGH